MTDDMLLDDLDEVVEKTDLFINNTVQEGGGHV